MRRRPQIARGERAAAPADSGRHAYVQLLQLGVPGRALCKRRGRWYMRSPCLAEFVGVSWPTGTPRLPTRSASSPPVQVASNKEAFETLQASSPQKNGSISRATHHEPTLTSLASAYIDYHIDVFCMLVRQAKVFSGRTAQLFFAGSARLLSACSNAADMHASSTGRVLGSGPRCAAQQAHARHVGRRAARCMASAAAASEDGPSSSSSSSARPPTGYLFEEVRRF